VLELHQVLAMIASQVKPIELVQGQEKNLVVRPKDALAMRLGLAELGYH
jgi:hypothetical protein